MGNSANGYFTHCQSRGNTRRFRSVLAYRLSTTSCTSKRDRQSKRTSGRCETSRYRSVSEWRLHLRTFLRESTTAAATYSTRTQFRTAAAHYSTHTNFIAWVVASFNPIAESTTCTNYSGRRFTRLEKKSCRGQAWPETDDGAEKDI